MVHLSYKSHLLWARVAIEYLDERGEIGLQVQHTTMFLNTWCNKAFSCKHCHWLFHQGVTCCWQIFHRKVIITPLSGISARYSALYFLFCHISWVIYTPVPYKRWLLHVWRKRFDNTCLVRNTNGVEERKGKGKCCKSRGDEAVFTWKIKTSLRVPQTNMLSYRQNPIFSHLPSVFAALLWM